MTEKSVFREAWSPELTSQSFPVSCFWCRGFVPHRKYNLTLLAHQNTGKENRYRNFFLLHLSAHWGDSIEQIKKICHIHFKWYHLGVKKSKRHALIGLLSKLISLPEPSLPLSSTKALGTRLLSNLSTSIPNLFQVRNLSYENEFCMQLHFHANQSHFHKNGFALRLALKQRHKGTRKWPISRLPSHPPLLQ